MRYWRFKDGSVQSCSNDNHKVPSAIEITKAVFTAYINSLSIPTSLIVRDPIKELDELKTKLNSIGITV